MQNCKVVVVGDGAVGKTSFLYAYVERRLPDDDRRYFDNYFANITVEGKQVGISLWDTAGQDDYDRLRPLSYPETDVFIIAYRVEDRSSFEHVTEKWIPEISLHCPGTPFVLVATKTDLREDQRVIKTLADQKKTFVTREEGEEFAKKIGAVGFFETSAIQLRGVDEVMQHAFRVGIGLIGMDEEPQKPPKPEPPACAPGPEICDDLEMIVNDKLFHDVVFRVEDKEIYGHKFVLCSASPLLSQLILEHQPVDKYFTCKADNDICTVSVSHVSHVELLEFVRFVYSGKPKQSPTNEFIQLAKVCGIDYTVNRRPQMASSISDNVKSMHDIEVIANDGKKFNAIKSLLWCRSEYFNAAITDPALTKINVDAPSRSLTKLLDYASEGILRHPFDEAMTLAKQWSSGMLRSIAYMLVSSEINLKNVYEWTVKTRDVFPEVHNYCEWLMKVNYHAIKEKKEFRQLLENIKVTADYWPGIVYECRYNKWQEFHGGKKKGGGDRCLVQ